MKHDVEIVLKYLKEINNNVYGIYRNFALLMIAYALSNNRKAIRFETVFWGLDQAFLVLSYLKYLYKIKAFS